MRHISRIMGRLFVSMTITHLPMLGFLNPILKCPAKALAPPRRHVILEEKIDLLQTLFRCLGVEEEDMNRHRRAESAKNHVCLPLDVGKRRWYEEGKGKIETAHR